MTVKAFGDMPSELVPILTPGILDKDSAMSLSESRENWLQREAEELMGVMIKEAHEECRNMNTAAHMDLCGTDGCSVFLVKEILNCDDVLDKAMPRSAVNKYLSALQQMKRKEELDSGHQTQNGISFQVDHHWLVFGLIPNKTYDLRTSHLLDCEAGPFVWLKTKYTFHFGFLSL